MYLVMRADREDAERAVMGVSILGQPGYASRLSYQCGAVTADLPKTGIAGINKRGQTTFRHALIDETRAG
ncbi:MAG: hypothetical protein M3Z75_27005 [Actinomycetota bacterium]|nr:hypothetical protein [Actinomycetota bacterium]